MTVTELIENIVSLDGVRVRFKGMSEDTVLIFWKEHYPIASIFLKANDYRVDYPKLYNMEYHEISRVVDSLDAYVQTDLRNRQINKLH